MTTFNRPKYIVLSVYKAKAFPLLTNTTPHRHMGNGGKTPPILNLGTSPRYSDATMLCIFKSTKDHVYQRLDDS